MATVNSSHHESGGVVLFSGELILLFCDKVNIQLPDLGYDEIGRLYLSTHRVVFTSKNLKGNFKSFSAPFYTMRDLSLEQPIFGANYIKGKVEEQGTAKMIVFKLKFYNGGAIEFGKALQNASRVTRNMSAQTPFQPPPPYIPSASQYYQAPPTIYQPAYNCGFQLPVDVFNQPPPAGFIYASEAPPPYPGLAPSAQAPYPQTQTTYPANQPQYPTSYPATQPQYPASYPATQPQYPASYPASQPQYPTTYPASQPAYPPSYTGPSAAYPSIHTNGGQPGYPPNSANYPTPTAPVEQPPPYPVDGMKKQQ